MKSELEKIPDLVYLGLGSNIAPREEYLIESTNRLRRIFPDEFQISAVYRTAPYMGMDQEEYWNWCVQLGCRCEPQELLVQLLEIEQQLGRTRNGQRWDSRVIDIDILLFGNRVIDEENLVIPHYDLSHRDFFLIPLLELAPTLIHPKTGRLLQLELDNLPLSERTGPTKIEFSPL